MHAPNRHRWKISPTLLSAGLVFGCLWFAKTAHAIATARMRLPEPLAAVEALPVRGRQGWKLGQELFFEGYLIHDVKRSWTQGADFRLSTYENNQRRQDYSFTLSDKDGPVWIGNCQVVAGRNRLEQDGFEADLGRASQLKAQFAPLADPTETWELSLLEEGGTPLRGTLKRGKTVLPVRGTDRLAGSPLALDETTGYAFEWERQSVAAVDVLNDGAVYLHPDLAEEHRRPVVSAIAALLLLEALYPSMPE